LTLLSSNRSIEGLLQCAGSIVARLAPSFAKPLANIQALVCQAAVKLEPQEFVFWLTPRCLIFICPQHFFCYQRAKRASTLSSRLPTAGALRGSLELLLTNIFLLCSDLNKLMEGLDFTLADRSGQLLTLIFVAMVFSSGIPLLVSRSVSSTMKI
jgi:hypothetical protein